MAGGGAALAGAGAVLFLLAENRQDRVDGARTQTVEDLDRLVALEDEGARLAFAGNILFIGGGVVLLAGGGLILYQGFSSAEVAVTPTPGGAGITLTIGWP
jgi:hypothetical protein